MKPAHDLQVLATSPGKPGSAALEMGSQGPTAQATSLAVSEVGGPELGLLGVPPRNIVADPFHPGQTFRAPSLWQQAVVHDQDLLPQKLFVISWSPIISWSHEPNPLGPH